ncbi:unnamed protein product [Effrenium voratum]|nr:unnamed protein product [Effrenium voratum]
MWRALSAQRQTEPDLGSQPPSLRARRARCMPSTSLANEGEGAGQELWEAIEDAAQMLLMQVSTSLRRETPAIEVDAPYAPLRISVGSALQALTQMSPDTQVSIHEAVPLLAVLLFLLVVWLLLLVSRGVPACWSEGEEKKGVPEGPRIPRHDPGQERPVDGSPVCASMMFPNAEAKFQLSLNSIRNQKTIEIQGTTGRTLMVALVGQTKERRPAVRVCYVNCETDPRCSVVASAHDEELAVLGRKDAPYGVVQRLHSHFHERCAVVKHKGQPLMRIEVNDVGSLDLLVVTPAGKQLAQGGSTDGTSWYLQVEPKADALLILTAAIGMVRLWSTSHRPSGTPPQRSPARSPDTSPVLGPATAPAPANSPAEPS